MSELSVHETLKAMRELLAVPERWTTVTYARTSDGGKCSPLSSLASSWCLRGAVSKVAPYQPLQHEIARAMKFHEPCWMANFNDTHTHAEVLARLDDAIKATAP